MKQTAVEWLENQLKNSIYFYKLMEDINRRSTVAQSDIFEQAKEMEKEQIIDAYETADKDCGKDFLHGDLYYHETFKSERDGN